MGYTTEFVGSVKLTPALTAVQRHQLYEFSEERHGDSTEHYSGYPGFWCNWAPNGTGTEIGWNGQEKFYDYTAWMHYIVQNFLIPWGITANGEIKWRGESFNDVGTLTVKDNRVTAKKGGW